MPKIQYTTPEGSTGEVELTSDRMTLGRADENMLVISDASVSSQHGEVAFENGEWVLTDFGSTNGTKVGGERVDRLTLTHGGVFALGNVECVFIGDAGAGYEAEQPAYEAPASHSFSSAAPTGYGAMPIDRSRRTGFGPKKKEKDAGSGLLIALGVIALLACGVAGYLFTQMSA